MKHGHGHGCRIRQNLKKGYGDTTKNILLLLFKNKFIKSQSIDQQNKILIHTCAKSQIIKYHKFITILQTKNKSS